MRQRRATPRRRDAPRADAAWWENTSRQLAARAQGRCERCGDPLPAVWERHHRQRRAVGGDRICNLLALDGRCHAWITEHPREAMSLGQIVSSYAPDPATVPVVIGGRSWLLDDDGGKIPAE